MEKQPVCLVIEDDPDIGGLIKAVLGRAGFNVRTAGSAAEGIAAAASLDLALVTLDMGLPDMDGRDAARALRALTRAPLLFLTARAEEDDVMSGLAAAGDAYLSKPFQPVTLRETALQLWGRQRTEPNVLIPTAAVTLERRGLTALDMPSC